MNFPEDQSNISVIFTLSLLLYFLFTEKKRNGLIVLGVRETQLSPKSQLSYYSELPPSVLSHSPYTSHLSP